MRKIPFLRICLMFVLGIYCNGFILGNLVEKIFLVFLTSASLSFLFYKSNHNTNYILPFGFSLLCCFFTLGIIADENQQVCYQKNHYSNQKLAMMDKTVFEGEVIRSKKTAKGLNIVVDLNHFQSDSLQFAVKGKINLITKKQDLLVGDLISFHGKIIPFNDANNLYAFNYKQFQKRKKIFHQSYTDNIWLLNRPKSALLSMRNGFASEIDSLKMSFDSKSILKAMLLGDKAGISNVESDFRSTGTSHVLAISGLHVGIIAAILYFLLAFLPKRLHGLKYILLIVGVWAFCLLSGLAPSTVRASIMVSCFFIAKLLNLKGFGLNFCFIAGFLMLLLDPNKIYDIGFQFSFLAVVGILLLYEPIYKSIVFKGKFDKIWQMSVMSLAAQTMLTPLSLYYFHEFPLLFIPASIIAIPATFLIISSGLLAIATNFLPIDFQLIASLLDWFIELFLKLLNILSSLEGTVVRQLWPSEVEVVLYYLCLFAIVSYTIFNQKWSKLLIGLAMTLILLIQFPLNFDLSKSKVVIYADTKNIHIDILNSGSALSYDENAYAQKRANWFREPLLSKNRVTETVDYLIGAESNFEINTDLANILILNDSASIPADCYDYILLNTPIGNLDITNNAKTIIDFSENKSWRNNHKVFHNQQFIIQ